MAKRSAFPTLRLYYEGRVLVGLSRLDGVENQAVRCNAVLLLLAVFNQCLHIRVRRFDKPSQRRRVRGSAWL